MSLPWFRMYSEFAGDPVIQSLAFEDQRHYVILLCLKCNGTLDRDIAGAQLERIIIRGLGLDGFTAAEAKRRLMEVGLVGSDWHPLGWDKRQYKSDVSSDRVRKYRNNIETGNVPETPENSSRNAPDTDTDTDTEADTKALKTTTALPRGLSQKTWGDFKDHRKALKAKLTPNAESRLLSKLEKMGAQGEDIEAAVSNSIENGWRGIFSPKNSKANQPKPGKMQRAAEALRRVYGDADSATTTSDQTGAITHAGPPARIRTDRR